MVTKFHPAVVGRLTLDGVPYVIISTYEWEDWLAAGGWDLPATPANPPDGFKRAGTAADGRPVWKRDYNPPPQAKKPRKKARKKR